MRKARKRIMSGMMALAMMIVLVLCMVVPSMAAQTGRVTINAVTGNTGVSYKGFNIFKADVNQDGSVSNLSWANDNVKNAVISAIQEVDNTYTSQNPQDAADFIVANTSATSTSQTLVLDNADFLNSIADAVDGFTATTTATPGTEVTGLETGYWLFVTDSSSLGTDEMGTAPIFTVVDSSAQAITSKASIPTVEKKVENADAYDEAIGETINFKLTGTLPANYATFDTYSYTFTDTLSSGLTGNANSVVIKIDGTTVDSGYTATLSNGVLTVAFADLNAAEDSNNDAIEVDSDSVITVDYTAELNSNAAIGSTGNNNSVVLTYSNNPNTNGTGSTTSDDVNTFSYKLHLEKKDRDTNVLLEGAVFTIKNADDEYVAADGTLSSTAVNHTASNGVLEITGLKAGTYTVSEVTAPTDYEEASDFTFTITPTYTGNALTALACTVSGDNVIAGLDTTNDRTMNADANSAAVVSTGVVNVTLGDVKDVDMPLSGQIGIALGIIAGCAILGVSVAAMRKNKASAKA